MQKNKKQRCKKCNDTGEVPCTLCSGYGYLFRPTKWLFFALYEPCPQCNYLGRTECPDCRNKRLAFAI